MHAAMRAELALIKIALAQVRLILAALDETNEFQTRNHQLNDGVLSPFMIVPFNDGSDPTLCPVHSLPFGS